MSLFPTAAVREAMAGSSSMKSPIAEGMMLRMNRVGPPTKTMIARSTASTMLMFDSHWMPFSIPEMAEATKQAVRTAIMATSIPELTLSTRLVDTMPPPICRAPSPREHADPNRVATIARILMMRPPTPSMACRPNREVNIAEKS